jgi:hypothetical protein
MEWQREPRKGRTGRGKEWALEPSANDRSSTVRLCIVMLDRVLIGAVVCLHIGGLQLLLD